MVYHWRPSRNLAKLLRREYQCRSLRGFHTSSSTRTASALGEKPDTVPSVSKTSIKIKKSYSELPKVWLNADGSAATPLGEWHGGLEDRRDATSQIASLMGNARQLSRTGVASGTSTIIESTQLLRPPVEEHSQEAEPMTPPKRTRRRKAATPAESTQLLQQEAETPSGEVEPAAPPKRTRRKRTSGTESATTPQHEVNQEVLGEPLATTVKRRRTRAPSSVVDEEGSEKQLPRSPLATEILSNLAKFPHCILLTRVGQFYESYFEQAAEVSQLLDIKLTDKSWGGQRVLMCGFPLMHLDRHLKNLVQNKGRLVALCEEFLRNPALGPKGGFNRRVSRIVTPGTLIDEPFLNQFENNYLLAISANGSIEDPTGQPSDTAEDQVGLAWIDVSTGEFFANHVRQDALRDELVRLGPKEVVLDVALSSDANNPIRKAIVEEGLFTSFMSPCGHDQPLDMSSHTDAQTGSDDLSTHLDASQPSLLGMTLTDAEVAAVKLLTAYMHAHLLEHMPQLRVPSRESTTGRMQIDAHTIKALEIKESMREGGTAGSLLNVVKRTMTSGGTRLLARWLCSPSTSLKEINARQALVAFFHSRPHLRADLVAHLGVIEDASRIIQKFLMGRGDAGDLSSMASTIDLWSTIKKRVELEKSMESAEKGGIVSEDWAAIDTLMTKLDGLQGLVLRINSAIPRNESVVDIDAQEVTDEDVDQAELDSASLGASGPSALWTIRPEFSPELAGLHTRLSLCLEQRAALEQRLQSHYDAPSLTLRSSPGLGMHVHIGRARKDAHKFRSDPLFIPLTQSASTTTFFYKEWSQLGSEIVDTTNAIYTAEKTAFEALRSDVNAYETAIRRNSRILDELDISLAFAKLAEDLALVRPTLKEDLSYLVVDGRHPTVELGLLAAGRTFTPNTVSFTPESPFHIITGPNMAGKSTLLRQTALIAILAQTGSFVPADVAEIGIIDKVFSRIGAKDDLFRDRSTFMVEMLETSDILKRATPQSLVIMDEVGRGTTVDDGLAIAFATVHHLLTVNHCRTLFATHFHELADMLGYTGEHKGKAPFERVSFFCTDVNDTEDGYFAYSHRLRPGVNRNSHGIKVAHLAGMPESAVGVAKTALDWLKRRREERRLEDQTQLKSFGQSLAARHTPLDTLQH